MKIRISNQLLRIRISREEALALNRGGLITTALQLSPVESFQIELQTWNLTIGEVHSETNKLLVSLPFEALQRLIDENGYAYSCEQTTDVGQSLTFEVEIDLQKEKNRLPIHSFTLLFKCSLPSY
ncbi:MAG: DUF7009 family protein [Flavobacteriales bacterium]